MWWRELGEVGIECAYHNFSLFAISLPKIIDIVRKLTKFWQKQFCTVFWDTVYCQMKEIRHTLELWWTMLSWSLRTLSGTRCLSASSACSSSSGTRCRSAPAGRQTARLTVFPLSISRHSMQIVRCPPCSIVAAVCTWHNNTKAVRPFAIK